MAAPLRAVVTAERDEQGRRIEALECGHRVLTRRDAIGFETRAARRRCAKCLVEAAVAVEECPAESGGVGRVGYPPVGSWARVRSYDVTYHVDRPSVVEGDRLYVNDRKHWTEVKW